MVGLVAVFAVAFTSHQGPWWIRAAHGMVSVAATVVGGVIGGAFIILVCG